MSETIWMLGSIIVLGWPIGWAISWFSSVGSVKLAARLTSVHRCGRMHPDWTHEQWVERVDKPRRARLYKQHGFESPNRKERRE